MNIVKKTRAMALKEIESTGFPNLTMFLLAESEALKLIKKVHVNKMITLVGYYLMDLKLGRAFQANKLKNHEKMSSTVANIFLRSTNLKPEIINKIINCIEAHHGAIPFICKEAEICANVDAYRFLHPRGFLAAVVDMGKRVDFKSLLDYMENKINEKYKILSLPICKKKLKGYYQQFKKLIYLAKKTPF